MQQCKKYKLVIWTIAISVIVFIFLIGFIFVWVIDMRTQLAKTEAVHSQQYREAILKREENKYKDWKSFDGEYFSFKYPANFTITTYYPDVFHERTLNDEIVTIIPPENLSGEIVFSRSVTRHGYNISDEDECEKTFVGISNNIFMDKLLCPTETGIEVEYYLAGIPPNALKIYVEQLQNKNLSISDDVITKVLDSFLLSEEYQNELSWKIYRNDEFGFEFRYPSTWDIMFDELGVAVAPKELIERAREGEEEPLVLFYTDYLVNLNIMEAFDHIDFERECTSITIAGELAQKCAPSVSFAGEYTIFIARGEGSLVTITNFLQSEESERVISTLKLFEPVLD